MNDQESLQAAIHEKVALCAYDPRWPAMFEAERKRLLTLLPNQFIAIAHFGSTAVPGLSAKPVIDILAGVKSMDHADTLLEPLCRARYTTSVEFNATLDDRRWLMLWVNGHRTHHLHLVVYGDCQWRQRLAFRDLLRSNQKLAATYEEHKERLAVKFASDREAYSQAKAAFVRKTLERHFAQGVRGTK